MAALSSAASPLLVPLQAGRQTRASAVVQRLSCRRQLIQTHAQASDVLSTLGRRQVLEAASLAALLVAPQASQAAKAPSGFNAVQDANDGYQFLYPFGWQEISVTGADVVYKDIVEPLESVSVTLTPTDKTDISDFGEIHEVTETLARDVLTPPTQEVKIISVNKRDLSGHNYYEVEFTAQAPRYTRHSLAVVAVNNGKLYTLTTGANERRWGKMKDRLQTVVRSFQLL